MLPHGYLPEEHQSALSMAIDAQYIEDFAEMAEMEFIHIGKDISISEIIKELRWNDLYYKFGK